MKCECGETKTTTINKASHTPGEWIIDVQPTATTPGSEHQICSVCKDTIQTKEIPATGGETTDPDDDKFEGDSGGDGDTIEIPKIEGVN